MEDANSTGPVPGSHTSPLRILIVEDESIPAEDLKETLVLKGYQVTAVARNSEKAILSARDDPPDLILMDINLGGPADGIDTAARILKSRSIPVIYLTAYADSGLMERAKKTRPYGYLLKPYDVRELQMVIEIAFYKHAADMQLKQANEDLELRVQERTRDLKKTNEELTAAHKKLALLNSITRHDILNQLLVLKSYIAFSTKQMNNPEKLGDFLGKAKKSADAIGRQIAFTRDYQDLGVQAASWQKPATGVAKAISELSPGGIQVNEDLGDLEVYADPLLEKVFYNLIENALRYGGPGMTRIRFFLQESASGLIIVVEDDGAGIGAEEKEHLFEKGFGKHTGLGLFLSREILSITGITITEESEPGKGARFEIAVPEGGYRFFEKPVILR
ncbi:MAG: response regulator [Methanoregula sp.]